MCDHLDDPFIQELLYEFKADGYLVYFGTISLICKENKYDITGKASFRGRFLKEKFHVSVAKLQQIYTFCQIKEKLWFNFCGKNFDFDFPKIAEIKDNFTAYSSELKGLTKTVRENIIKRDGEICGYCGKPCYNSDLVIDHIIPFSKNGETKEDNLIVCCRSCNSKKRDRTPEGAGMKFFKVTSKSLRPKKKKEEVEEEVDKRIVRKKDFAPLREKFELLWKTLPPEMKRGKEKAWGKFKIQVNTDQDLVDIQKAVPNYLADVQIKREDFPELQFQNGQTWFNLNWKDYVKLEPKLKGATPMEQASIGRGEFVDKVLKTADRLQSEHPEMDRANISNLVLQSANGDLTAARKVLHDFGLMEDRE